MSAMKARQSAAMLAAAHRGDWRKATTLLREGADPNVCGAHGVSVLMLAAAHGAHDACADLLAWRALPNVRGGCEGSTPLTRACCSGAVAPSLIRLLLESAADVHGRDGSSRTPLIVLAEQGPRGVREWDVRDGQIMLDAAHTLLEFHADLQAVAYTDGAHEKAMKLRPQVVHTFYHNRTKNPVEDFAKTVREYEVFFNDDNHGSSTSAPLSIELDVDPQSPSVQQTAQQDDTINSFTDVRAIRSAVTEFDGSQASDAGVSVEWTDAAGRWFSRVAPLRPKDLVKQRPPPEVMKTRGLQAQGLRGVPPLPSGSGDTALMASARRGCSVLCELLLALGADTSVKDNLGETSLETAARNGRTEVVRCLLAPPVISCIGGTEGLPPIASWQELPSSDERNRALRLAEAGGWEETAHAIRGYKPPAT